MRNINKLAFLISLIPSLVGAQTEHSWSKLYESLFSQKVPINMESTEKVLEEKFRTASNPLRTQLALLLMKMDEERPAPKGVWADWILDSSEVDNHVVSHENRCAALQQSAAAQFLARNFHKSHIQYEKLASDATCTWDQRDFAEFQRGWIFVNQKVAETALKTWITLLQKIVQREDTSLYKLSILKETAALSLVLKTNSYFQILKPYAQTSQEKDAITEGALNALSSVIKSKDKFLKLRNQISHDFEIERLRRLFPSTKLYLLSSACQNLEWYPDSYDTTLLGEKAELCAEEIYSSKKAIQKEQAHQFTQNMERFGHCETCVIEVAKMYAFIGESLKSCQAIIKAEIIQNSAQLLNLYCSRGLNSEDYKRFFKELKGIEWNKINSENLKAFSDFIRNKIRNESFSRLYLEFLERFENKKEKSISFLALDYLKNELSRNYFHREILETYISLNSVQITQREWNSLASAYLLNDVQTKKGVPAEILRKLSDLIAQDCSECVAPYMQISIDAETLSKSWERFLKLPNHYQYPDIYASLFQLSLDSLVESKITFQDLEKHLVDTTLLNNLKRIIEENADLSILKKSVSLFRADQLAALKHYLLIQKHLSEIAIQIQKKKYSHLQGVANFIKKSKTLFALRSKLDTNLSFLMKKIDEKTYSLFSAYKTEITSAPQDAKTFWHENPKIAEQVLALIGKWELTLGEESSS